MTKGAVVSQEWKERMALSNLCGKNECNCGRVNKMTMFAEEVCEGTKEDTKTARLRGTGCRSHLSGRFQCGLHCQASSTVSTGNNKGIATIPRGQ